MQAASKFCIPFMLTGFSPPHIRANLAVLCKLLFTFKCLYIITGDTGEKGDKGATGIGIDGPDGDQGLQGKLMQYLV